jgi:hypothetical protein
MHPLRWCIMKALEWMSLEEDIGGWASLRVQWNFETWQTSLLLDPDPKLKMSSSLESSSSLICFCLGAKKKDVTNWLFKLVPWIVLKSSLCRLVLIESYIWFACDQCERHSECKRALNRNLNLVEIQEELVRVKNTSGKRHI